MQRRKDNKGRVLKDGEVYRKSDGLYMYRWTAKNGKRHTIYDATLEGLREKEEKIQHDLADGLRIPECSLTLNDLFELWRKNKVGLKEHTFANYVYMYNRFVRDEIGMMKLKDIRKSYIRSYQWHRPQWQDGVEHAGNHPECSSSGLCGGGGR